MNRIAATILIASLSGTAAAQQSSFTYTGTVVSVNDEFGALGSLATGDEALGSFALDLNADDQLGDVPGLDIGLFDAVAFLTSAGDLVFDADAPAAVVLNDFGSFSNPDIDGELFDSLIVGAGLVDLPAGATQGQYAAYFEGTTDWFDTTDLPDATTFGLDNLLSAEVVIEFARAEGFDPDNPSDDFTIQRAQAVIRINSIANNDGTIATIGCRALQFASPVARADFFDVSAFLSEFSGQSPLADFNGDGLWNFFDVSSFISEYNSACMN
ncbi:MAG: GC-type dockerin domain-anchored protein [Planctomycetota bacterium]